MKYCRILPIFLLLSALMSGLNAQNVDVYIVGYERGNIFYPDKIKLWHNSTETDVDEMTFRNPVVFPPGIPILDFDYWRDVHVFLNYSPLAYSPVEIPALMANSCQIANGHVYIAGYKDNIATLWIDSVSYPLGIMEDDTMRYYSSNAYSVFVADTDVYIAGYIARNWIQRQAVLWKNGIAQILADTTNSAYAYSVFVKNNDVYAAGTSAERATIWKNGVPEYFSDGYSIYDIFVTDTVYAIGRSASPFFYQHKLWKNGVSKILTSGQYAAELTSLFVSNDKVYVTGHEKNDSGKYVAKLWLNGVAANLSSGMLHAYANSVYVYNNDVYVVGSAVSHANARELAVLWVNGAKNEISSIAQTYGKSIVVTRTTNIPTLVANKQTPKVYPNPTCNNVEIRLPESSSVASFTLSNLQGKILITKQIEDFETLSLSHLSGGMYLYRITTQGESYTGKLVKY